MQIERVLEISTAHLPQDVMEHIHLHECFRVLVDEFGAFVWVPPNDGRSYIALNTPPELIHVLNFAQQCDCKWINFDRDADIIEELPHWEW